MLAANEDPRPALAQEKIAHPSARVDCQQPDDDDACTIAYIEGNAGITGYEAPCN